MSKEFTTRIRRLASALIFVLVGALSLGVWLLLSDASPSDAAITISPADVSVAAAKLETLHERTMARTQGTSARTKVDEDDKDNLTSRGHAISPERAAMLAIHVARARGDTATSHSYIELQTRNGWDVYAVRIGAASVYIHADTGAVVT